MGFTSPTEPEFEIEDWAGRPYPERVRMMCDAWAMQGFGAPGVAYLFYILKIGLYIGGFLAFAVTTEGGGSLSDIGDWWANPVIYGKAVLWTLMYEALGLGCGSGPLTGRYTPPVTAVIAFTRIGSPRLRPFTWVPFTEGHRRTWVDVALYAGLLALVVRALVAAQIELWQLIPIVAVLCVLGLRDKTIFLAARSEHYLLDASWSSAVRLRPVRRARRWCRLMRCGSGAATSKLTLPFPERDGDHACPTTRIQRSTRFIRKEAVSQLPRRSCGGRGWPRRMAHTATAVEFLFPLTAGVHGQRAGCRRHRAWRSPWSIFHLGIILTSVPHGGPARVEHHVHLFDRAGALRRPRRRSLLARSTRRCW
ncbi:MAG: DUF3556 domain-containing protein [Microthrixaceae bacterium]